MTEIYLETFINAPIRICFDLSRSIDLHKISLEHTDEKAIGGRTSGLIEKDEFVTWQAKHFGIRQNLTVKITAVDSPVYFCDEMVKGTFKSMRHEHFFEQKETETLMKDKFCYETPFWFFGQIFDAFVLKDYMKRLLETRNQTIKRIAESEDWKKLLPHKD